MNAGKLIEFSLGVAEKWTQPKGTPLQQQQKVLSRLLKKAKATEFGKYYNFKKISKQPNFIETYQQVVPFHDYNQLYDQWWHRTLAGESNVTWPRKVKYFALSSGTSNATSKRIPISHTMFKMLRQAALRLFTNIPAFHPAENIYTKSWLGIGGTSRMDKVHGHFEGYLSGINARKRPFWTKGFYRPGDKITTITEFNMRTDFIAAAAANWDVGLIIGIPHWVQITMERILKDNQLDTLNEIWPNLGIFISGGVDYKPYQKTIEALVGHPITNINTYMASEGMIAYQDDPNQSDLQLLLDGGIFFEFVPFNTANFDDEGNLRGKPRAYTVAEVKEGIDYAVIISTCSGAWRYLLGDTVRFTDVEKGRITIAGRTKYYLNLCTEHLTGDNMIAAISRTEEALDIAITEFTIAPMRKDNYFKHHWFIGLNENVDGEVVKNLIDTHLKALNDDYKAERETALSMDLEIVPITYFYEWLEKHSNAAGQSKMPRVTRGKALESWQQFLVQKTEVLNPMLP